jgi:hypothetical protein
MSDDEVTLIQDDRVTHIEDVLAAAPIEPGKLGHHTVLSVGGARVIVLAFGRGQHMREHRSHHPLLLQALDGKVRVITAEQTVDLAGIHPVGRHLPGALDRSLILWRGHELVAECLRHTHEHPGGWGRTRELTRIVGQGRGLRAIPRGDVAVDQHHNRGI